MVFLVNMANFTSANTENYAEDAKKYTTRIYNKLSLKTLLLDWEETQDSQPTHDCLLWI